MPERRHDLHRFLTFVDACVAIAVTLLVLPLVDAAADRERGESLGHFLDRSSSTFWAFLLGFAVIAFLWLGHHGYVAQLGSSDRTVEVLVLGWTLTLVLLPFPTALISSYGSERGMVALYVGLLLVISLLLTLGLSQVPGVGFLALLVLWPTAVVGSRVVRLRAAGR